MANYYLLHVKFYAGSDDPEDIDTGMYLLRTSKTLNYEQIKRLFNKINKKLDPYDNPDLGFSYANGLNINILMDGLITYLNKTDKRAYIKNIFNDCGPIAIDNFYEIEQWQ